VCLDYFVVEQRQGPFELREKGSKFMAFLFPILNEDEAEKCLESLRREHHDASHTPFALRLGDGVERLFRYSDDGEPGGTGGLPLYQELTRAGLFNTLLAVVRYFGGTKLGTGNLKRAFSRCARGLLESAAIVRVHPRREFSIFVPFDLIGEAMHLVNLYKGGLLSRDYAESGVRMRIFLPVENADIFRVTLLEKSSGLLSVESPEGDTAEN
jgi:putative IMPACT (imprinted ancient) family translation regulator